MNQIIILGQMDNSDGTHEQLNRGYSASGVSATLFCGGGGKVIVEFYQDQSEQRTRVL